ncbi:MAG: DUF2141 domain-containing protein [Gluconacetobacter diazotrophicus]|nr:DUF2141 domain-containing protein [Gluconacetobacter diazotrophicus]
MRSSATAARLRDTLLAALLCAAPSGAALAATVTIAVHGVRDDRGHVRIGLCTRDEFLGEHCRYHAVLPSRAGTVTAVLPDVSPGTYAATAYQDDGDLGHLRRSFLGIPQNGMGASRDPRPRFGPPRFDQAAMSVGTRDAVISLILRYR